MGGIPLIGAVILIAVVIIFGSLGAVLSRFKRCPSDKILVVFGKIGSTKNGESRSARCIHGGAAFIWPVIQNYEFLDLTPMSIDVNLTKALSKQNIRVDVPSSFTIGITTEKNIMNSAAERLLGLSMKHVQELAKEMILGQMRLIVATMDIEEINTDRDKFLTAVSENVETELQKIGLKLINVNVQDIKDESGYISALGKEAAAQAINDAKKVVAEKERDGEIGKAEAERDKEIKVAEADRDRRIKMSEANAKAIEGENLAKIEIADSEATRRERAAEADRKAVAAEKVQQAKALEESYKAEKTAELERASREKATKEADVLVPAEIQKRKIEIDAEAEAEKRRRHAKGEADGIYFKMEAEAKGLYEVLTKQAEGFERLVKASGGDSKNAAMLMIADKLETLVQMQVDAIKNIKIDKVTVWDSNGGSGDGKGGTSTANFLSGMAKSIPPLEDLFNMSGMKLPDYLGTTLEDAQLKLEDLDKNEKIEELKKVIVENEEVDFMNVDKKVEKEIAPVIKEKKEVVKPNLSPMSSTF